MTSNHHAPYDLGYTRATMAFNKGKRACEGEQISKTTVNTFPGLVHTARHTMGVSNARSQ